MISSILYLNILIFIFKLFLSGDPLRVKIACDVLPDLPPPIIKFYRANRELREDSRTNYGMMDNQAMMQIKKTRFTDEAKYSLTLEQDGVVVDKVTWSVFIKGNPLVSQLPPQGQGILAFSWQCPGICPAQRGEGIF